MVGESGSGKTTLGRCILRLYEPTQGKIFFNGQDLVRLSHSPLRRLRAQMQIVYQNPWEAFNPRMNVTQVIEEPLRLHTNMSG
ncbi:MAG: ATP-binding cassette domain-containing protein, partial [Dehalococcoidia bacterium]